MANVSSSVKLVGSLATLNVEIGIFVSKNESCFNLLFEKKRDEKIAQHLNSIIYHNRMFFSTDVPKMLLYK